MGVFPSVALAWRMNEENFLKNVEQLSNLKLRLSYGISGNSAVSAYQTQGGLGKTMYAYLINNTENGAYGYYPALTPNYNLGWEKQQRLISVLTSVSSITVSVVHWIFINKRHQIC